MAHKFGVDMFDNETEGPLHGRDSMLNGDQSPMCDQSFRTWAAHAGLNAVTTLALIAHDCADLESLSMLQDGDFDQLGLTVGQSARLRNAVEGTRAQTVASARLQLNHTSRGQTHQSADCLQDEPRRPLAQEEPPSLETLLGALSMHPPLPIAPTATESAAATTTTPAESAAAREPLPSFMNPEIYLTNSRKSGKHLDIVDFVTRGFQCAEEEVLAGTGAYQVIIKSGPAKVKLDSVTPNQWVAANARIMAELVTAGSLKDRGILQYLAYTCKVGDLADRYDWKSVLLYDREYRVAQSHHDFLWGMDIPHIITTCLREKPPPAPAGAKNNLLKQNTKDKVGKERFKNGRVICRMYNQGSCTYNPCKFIHACAVSGCTEKHPESEHKGPV